LSDLERRYRLLLRWYPAAYRRRHEDEMVGVLLSDADPGQRRPNFGEAVDLVRAGLRIWFRHLSSDFRRAEWRDAAAIVSLLLALPLLLLSVGYLAPKLKIYAAVAGELAAGENLILVKMFADALYFLCLAAGSLLALLGRRRPAVIAIVTAGLIELSWMSVYVGVMQFDYFVVELMIYQLPQPRFLVCVLFAAALLASAGPRRGLQLTGPLVAAATMVPLTFVLSQLTEQNTWYIFRDLSPAGTPFFLLLGSAIFAVGWLARTVEGRRATALFLLFPSTMAADRFLYPIDPLTVRILLALVVGPMTVLAFSALGARLGQIRSGST
jgi:hypothetical protein